MRNAIIGGVVATAAVCGIAAFALMSSSAPKAPSPGDYDFARVDQAIEKLVASNHLKGAAIILVRGEEHIFEKAYGEYTLDTTVTTGSASKWASAAAFMSLVEDGTLQLDEPVSKYVPSFALGPRKAAITLRQCLSHTAGLEAKHDCLREYRSPLSECVDQIARRPLAAPPGRAFGYGSLTFHVAAGMAENATGKSWREIFDDHVKTPLGLDDTQYGWRGYSSNPGIAGNLVTSANDFADFLQMMLNGGSFGGKQILSQETVTLIESGQMGLGTLRYNHIPDRHARSTHDLYGLGVWRDVVGRGKASLVVSSPGKFGFTPWIDRRVGVAGVVVMSYTEDQLARGKPPDPASLIYLVCDAVDTADRGEQPTPNPHCKRVGMDPDWPYEEAR